MQAAELAETLAAELAKTLAAELAIELAVLFGSLAAGRPRPSSDVDLAIRWAPGATAERRAAVLARIEREMRRSVDAIELDQAPPLLRMEIARHGVVVLERVAGAWSGVRARAMLDWWDFAPYARIMHEAARARLEAAVRGAG